MKNSKFVILIFVIMLHMFGIIRFTTGCFPWQACKPSVYVYEIETQDSK